MQQRYSTTLKRIDIPEVTITDFDDKEEIEILHNRLFKKVSVPKKAIVEYNKSFDKSKPFLKRAFSFVKATILNKRTLKILGDVVSIAFPRISGVVDTATLILNKTIIPMRQETKPKSRSKTIITFGLLFLVGLLSMFGIIPEDLLPLSPDAEWVTVGVSAVAVILRLFTKQPVDSFPLPKK